MPSQLSDDRAGTRDRVLPALQAAAADTCDAIQGLVAMVRRIDNALVFIDRALRISQPPIARKLGIRFWIPTCGAPRVPVLVAWKRIKNRRWRAEHVQRLSRGRIHRTGNAGICADNTYRLAVTAIDLIRLRAALVGRLHALRKSANGARGRYGLIDHAEATIIAEHDEIVRRLEGAGYAVDERAKGLADQYLG